MIKVCLIGLGRTGKEIARVLLQQQDLTLTMAVCSPYSDKPGKDLGSILNGNDTGIIMKSSLNLAEQLENSRPDVAIDFTNPESTLDHAEILGRLRIPLVVGTTGFSELQQRKLMYITRKYRTGIISAPNITLGVNVLMVLTNLTASILDGYDCTIVESHFKQKKDAPSGTAVKIANEVLKGRSGTGVNLHELDHREVPIHAIRAGGIIGRHSVVLAGEFDKIEITHEAFARTAFALGALKAVRFICGKIGYYEMDEVLDLKNVILRYLEREANIRSQRFGGELSFPFPLTEEADI
ncbi:4-hydroxy-tetrahydrodipicolinate reductase [Acididesulfobacillus acetoxydans]|uniref:4-hydroxy-tetrahydrodipicolinate reductase n=1 Tax=Acididesulfobacillus acetoxydans TaxID=1561005 RepID=A0A8S0XA38_9FIRM|nr:4-hydroxy-tetrahydrodipicolinate reductase [Acididesulfobacillus acetoxydans]CAA7599486.1 4-hydroxy-tetrahydrodipicolinate reductase [Acididesulfobacillus acetoxydans]CEJ09285.1 4-hydroxy-tetrahydrodipicolinate reductase [Acididesulfobacillus acetoxydans]